jgi:hypothetical protein
VKPVVNDSLTYGFGGIFALFRKNCDNSCPGCPFGTVSIKNEIEQLLTAEMPVVKEVVAESV